MFRKVIVALVMIVMINGCAQVRKDNFSVAWKHFHSAFYDNGRIVDTGNENVSHSEGQGYGMLFAVTAGDKAHFDEIWKWTADTLQRADKLFSWRYVPCAAADRTCVDDPNNAPDGDLLIAWSLLRAADKWQEEHYRKSALAILAAMRSAVVVAKNDYVLLLPGEQGFTYPNGDVQINLSYWIFPALHAAADATGDESWDDLAVSGISLITQANAQWSLTPDWLRVTSDGISIENVVNAEFGFNACRIPLQLAWQNVDKSVAQPFLSYWNNGAAPATRNLATGETAEYGMTAGMIAVNKATAALYQQPQNNTDANNSFVITDKLDYYSASLVMLSLVALKDGGFDEG